MAKAGVILPSEPLFIVDRSWRVQTTSKTPNDLASAIIVLDGQKVTRATPSTADTRNSTQTADRYLSSAVSQGRDSFQFIAANEPGGRQDKAARTSVKKYARKHVSSIQKGPASTGQTMQTDVMSLRGSQKPKEMMDKAEPVPEVKLSLRNVVPNASWSLYGNSHTKEPTGLEDYLHYYRHVISNNAYPLEKHMQFDFNPIRGTCFPVALADRLFLQTIMLISALHHAYVTGTSISRATEDLNRRVLMELRSRIAHKDVSDATLLSVSCLALIGNLFGQHSQWRIHNTGMNEMIRLRGGIYTIDTSIRWKIYRADMVGAVDTMKRPILPHPGLGPNLNGLATDFNAGLSKDTFVTPLSGCDVSQSIQNVYGLMHQLVQTISDVFVEKQLLSTSFYDDSCMYIQHDLLAVQLGHTLDESWQIAGLVFMSTFTKSRPFLGPNCRLLSERLRLCYQGTTGLLEQQTKQRLWLAFMGGLVSFETIDHEWFIEQLSHIVQVCGCTTWYETKAILQETLWLEVLHDEAGLRLWKDISMSLSLTENAD